MINEQMYNTANEVVKLYERQLRHLDIIKCIPKLDKDMILEYKDLTGRWYEYTKDLQQNIHFIPPFGTRVRRIDDVKI